MAQNLRTIKLSQITSILLGTNKNKTVSFILHLVFWIVIYKWFLYQAQWVTGGKNPEASLLIATQRYIVILFCFYGISYVFKLKSTNLRSALYIFTILIIVLFIYGLSVYYLYEYINNSYTMPPYYQRFMKSISRLGPMTFIKDHDLLYYHFEQLGIALFVPLTIKIYRVALESKIEKLKLEKNNISLELNFLRSQINPHFLFNTLNSVYSLIEDKDEVAASIIFSLSNMMRYSLYESNTTGVEVIKELNFIKSYIDIQNVRHSKKLIVTMDFDEDFEGFKIPPLLLINFVENAFKHGADKMIKESWIKISASYKNNEFHFNIINLKPETPTISKNSGIGVANTKRRLDIIYKERHSLDIIEDEKTYQVVLKIW